MVFPFVLLLPASVLMAGFFVCSLHHAMKHPLLLLLLAGLVPALPVRAQALLTGTVHDSHGQPLVGASVLLREEATGQLRAGTASDEAGAFTLVVRPGTWQLTVSFLGFTDHRATLTLAAGSPQHQAIVLEETRLPGTEVVVTANRAVPRLTPLTYSNLTAQALDLQPEMKDLPVHLANLPSVTWHSENGNGIGYSTLRMRGFDQRRLAVSINGIPQNDPETFDVFWINFFDLQGAVEDIQVQRGAGAAFYGPTGIGGAINIVANPYRPEAYAQVELGTGAFGTQRASVEANTGLRNDRYVAFARLSRLRSDGYRAWSWTEFWRFFGGLTRYGNRATLTLQAYGGPQRDGLAYIGIPKAANKGPVDDGFGGTIDRRYNYSARTGDVEHFHQPHVELLHDLRLSDRMTFNQTLFWIKGEGFFDFDGSFRSADYLRLPAGVVPDEQRSLPLYLSKPEATVFFRAYLDQHQGGWMPRLTYRHARGETTVGAELRLHRSRRWGRIEETTNLPPEQVGPANDARVYDFRGEKAIASLFASHLHRPAQRLAVQGDVQITYNHFRNWDEAFFGHRFKVPYAFVNPRLGVTFNPDRPLRAYASLAYAGREPRLKSLYDGEEAGAGFQPAFETDADGTLRYDRPLVRPEHLLNVELGTALEQPRYRLSANVYLMDFRDEIVPSGGLDQFGVPRTGNADRTRHRGLELEGAVRLARSLDVEGNLSLSRNRFIRFTEYEAQPDGTTLARRQDGNPIAGFPDQTANLGLVWHWQGLTTTARLNYGGRQYIDNSGGTLPDGTPSEDLVLDPYMLVHASLQYTFPARAALQGLRLSLDVNNVFDHRVLLFGNVSAGVPQFFPYATRHLFFGLRYTVR